jgi:hypothetical protein
MSHDTYKYRFDESVPAQELEDTFMLAMLAVESLHGRSRVRMESRFNLDKVLSVIPYMPDITGIMDGDFHFIQTKEELSVSSNLKIDNMTYEKCPMGNVGSEFTYMPKSDGSHYVDAILTYEGDEVATVTGTYKSEGAGDLDAEVGLEKLPLHFINGFVPDQLIGFFPYKQ